MVATGDCNLEGPFAAFLTFDVAQVSLGHGGRNVPRAGYRDRFLAVEMLDYVLKTVGADNQCLLDPRGFGYTRYGANQDPVRGGGGYGGWQRPGTKALSSDNSPSATAFSNASCEIIPMAANSAKAIFRSK